MALYMHYVLPLGASELPSAWSAQRAGLGQKLHHRHVVSGLTALYGKVRLQQQVVELPELVCRILPCLLGGLAQDKFLLDTQAFSPVAGRHTLASELLG